MRMSTPVKRPVAFPVNVFPGLLLPACCGFLLAASTGRAAEGSAANLLPGVKAVWDVERAHRESTPTRERICLNGLWQWQPADSRSSQPPAKWGWFKVPGCWPGITDYMQKDSQTVHAHPAWKGERLGALTAAWYRREMTVPRDWGGRRITLRSEYLNSFAAVFVDGVRAGELRFPGGDLEITSHCKPGRTHTLSLLVVAMPLKGVMLSYTDSASARGVQGRVARRGLCGDVFLVGTPSGARCGDVRIATSVRRGELTVDVALDDLPDGERLEIRARITRDGALEKEFNSRAFQAGDLQNGRLVFTERWRPEHLWDTHTPDHLFTLEVSLLNAAGGVLDTVWPQRFGFREFWIDGRDFYLNGKRIFLSAVPLDNAQVSVGLATYSAARESLERLQSFGINFVYTHNYGCEPGAHLGFEEILRAADDVGMLVAFSQPHFSHYDWQESEADRDNGYARHAEFYVRAAQNHPSVVAYSMSHNATGYNDDMNPDMIDGVRDTRDSWAMRNMRRALRAEAIVKGLDPDRLVYHHASGNLGVLHASNFYPNFVPIQELSDWFEHWAREGIKPVFMCEYGAPFSWDWTLYRGWYEGKREFGSAAVPWEFCLAEWNAQFLGSRAYRISEAEKTNLRWEARQVRAGKLWHRWDYPFAVGSRAFDERFPVFAAYLTDNWRAFRTWGVSAISPWEHGHFWKLRDGVDKSRRELPVDWANLQRPGFSPDFIHQRYERMDLAFERSDWIGTPAAQALLRNNRPLLAYLAGKPGSFTSKDHVFLPGESFEKQVVVINNAREAVTAGVRWHLNLPHVAAGGAQVTVEAGQQTAIPLRLALPASLPAGNYDLEATVTFGTGQVQRDRFTIEVVPLPDPVSAASRIALFDPHGETQAMLDRLEVAYRKVGAEDRLSSDDLLIVGKSGLTPGGPAPKITRVRDGLKVIVFEQSTEVLEKRLGFRTTEYGLRQVYPRVPDHPALAGLGEEHLRDWRGEATSLPPRVELAPDPKFNRAPTVKWCGITVPRLWRCGNRGNVASVLIEKPARGDFLPILDGGFSLQYSPLMEYREGHGMVLFCQADVTGRSEAEPAADALMRNLLAYVSMWEPAPRRRAIYLGDPAGRNHLESLGVALEDFNSSALSPDQVLIVSPGAGQIAAKDRSAIADWVSTGGHLLAIGLDQNEAAALLPIRVGMRNGEHIASFFEAAVLDSPLAGVSPADVHNRDPRAMPLVSSGAEVIGNGVLAMGEGAKVLFCQLAPWQFDDPGNANHRRTHRRASFLLSRLLANLGVESANPLLERFHHPIDTARSEQRWLTGLYLDTPREWDDPYRFFRW